MATPSIIENVVSHEQHPLDRQQSLKMGLLAQPRSTFQHRQRTSGCFSKSRTMPSTQIAKAIREEWPPSKKDHHTTEAPVEAKDHRITVVNTLSSSSYITLDSTSNCPIAYCLTSLPFRTASFKHARQDSRDLWRTHRYCSSRKSWTARSIGQGTRSSQETSDKCGLFKHGSSGKRELVLGPGLTQWPVEVKSWLES